MLKIGTYIRLNNPIFREHFNQTQKWQEHYLHTGQFQHVTLWFSQMNERGEYAKLFFDNSITKVTVIERDEQNKPLLLPYLDRFLTEIVQIDQASAQWTLSQLFGMLTKEMTETQIQQAKAHMQHNLAHHTDWIVLAQTMETLTKWSKKDAELQEWLQPQLERLSKDERKAVAGKAKKMLAKINGS